MGDTYSVAELQRHGLLLVEDGNHGEYRPRAEEFVPAGVALVRASDLSKGRVDFGRAQQINDVALARIKKGVGQDLDVLLSHKGTVGKVAFVPNGSPRFVCSPQTTFWRSLDHKFLAPRYLYYFLQSPQFVGQLRARENETDMAAYVSLTQQRELLLELPAEGEQQAIAEVLGALDDKIALNEQIAATALDLGRSHLAQAVLIDGTVAAVGDFAQLKYGKALPAPERRPGGVPVFGCTGQVGFHDLALTDSAYPVVGRKGANAGHVSWLPRAGWVIDTAFYAEPLRGDIVSEVLYFLLDSADLDALIADSAVPGINRNVALRHRMRLPSPANLARFTSQARSILSMREQAFVENRTLAELRDTLLPELVSGKLRIKDATRLVEEVV
jgi:type I restriction enzyme S subunit